jgi:molecular chaperone GrpE
MTMPDAKKPNPELEQLKNELVEMESLAKRVQADFTNFRRRAEEDRSLLRELVKEEVITKLLPILDNLDRAATHVPDELAQSEWVKGISGIHQQLVSALAELGVEKVEAVGERFEPSLHEAIAYGSETERGEHEVMEEFEPGWRLGGRVIRPAKVRVNQKGER